MLNRRSLITLVAFALGEAIQILTAVFTTKLLPEQTVMLMVVTSVSVVLLVGLGMLISQWDTRTYANAAHAENASHLENSIGKQKK